MMDFSYLRCVHWRGNSLKGHSTGGKSTFEKTYKVAPLKTNVFSTNTQKTKTRKCFPPTPLFEKNMHLLETVNGKADKEWKKCLIRKILLSNQLLTLRLGSSLLLWRTCGDSFLLTSPSRPAAVWMNALQNKHPLGLPCEQKLLLPLFVSLHNSSSQVSGWVRVFVTSVAVSYVILVFKAQRGDCYCECQIFIKVEPQMAKRCTAVWEN